MVGWGLLWCRPVLGLHGAAVTVGGLSACPRNRRAGPVPTFQSRRLRLRNCPCPSAGQGITWTLRGPLYSPYSEIEDVGTDQLHLDIW